MICHVDSDLSGETSVYIIKYRFLSRLVGIRMTRKQGFKTVFNEIYLFRLNINK